MITLDAGQLARGWLATYQATGKEAERPALCRTLHIDQFSAGVRLAATDSTMLLTCWVPATLASFEPEPGLDEVPYASATVIDRHGRAAGLAGYLLALSKDDDHKGLEVTLQLNVPWQPDDTPEQDLQIDGFEALAVTVEQPERERLQLEVYEGAYPSWQGIVRRQRKARTDALTVSPVVAGRLSKAARVFGDTTQIRLRFGGKDKPVQVKFGDEPTVTGLIMPCRWDFHRDAPYGQAEEGDGE